MNKPKHTFFCEDINSGQLSEEESKHAIRVLRLNVGDIINIINGKGHKSLGEITVGDKKSVQFTILEDFQENYSELNIHIAIAPTKNIDRFSFFLEKVTEIGVQKITPIICSNSERQNLKIEKLKKNLISALKQSGNLFLPQIESPTDFKTFIDHALGDSQKFIAHCEDDENKKELRKLADSSKNIVILIGPEGDFSPEEIKLAIKKGFTPVSLGESRLRTETAGIVACHTLHVIQ